MTAKRSVAPAEDDFLPDGYEPPTGGGKFFRPSKLPAGETRFRVLAKPLIGQEGWIKSGTKPTVISKPLGVEFTEVGMEDIKHMWWMPVFDYRSASVMLAQISQSTIQGKIESLSRSQEWGTPLAYDLIITKTGSGMDTEYDVMPGKPKPLDAAAHDAWQKVQAAGFDMRRVFSGDDPFGSNGNGVSASFDPGADSPSAGRKFFFIKLGEGVSKGIFLATTRKDSVQGKLERRKLLRSALGGDPDPTTMTGQEWLKAADWIGDVIQKNEPPAGVGADPDADIPF